MSGRWYDHQGNLYGQVPTKAGGWRDFDLRDARKVDALGSVTTILGILAKPGLVRWQVLEGIKAAYNFIPLGSDPVYETREEYYPYVYNLAQEYTHWTQSFGNATHWWLNKKLRAVETTEIPPMIAGSEECADGVLEWLNSNGYEFALTEHRFARQDLGYAGTVDLIGTRYGSPVICDLKTQEPPLTPYLDHALQLAGYDYALNYNCTCSHVRSVHGRVIYGAPGSNIYFFNCQETKCDCKEFEHQPRERISLIANRLNPGEVKEHIWCDKDSTIEATNARYDQIWLGLVSLWQGLNQYVPGVSND